MKYYHCIENGYLKLEIDEAEFKRPATMLKALFKYAEKMGMDIKKSPLSDYLDDPRYAVFVVNRYGTSDHRYVEKWADVNGTDKEYIAFAFGWDEDGYTDNFEPAISYGFINMKIDDGDNGLGCYYHGPSSIRDNHPSEMELEVENP